MIAAVHNACIGGGIDMISACDIRLCSQDAFFVIKVIKVCLNIKILSESYIVWKHCWFQIVTIVGLVVLRGSC